LLLKKGAVGASFVRGLLQNNTLVTWGMNREYQTSIPACCGSGIQDIAVGTNFALALKGGRVYGWGANTRGQLNFPTTSRTGITAVAAGCAHGLALTSTGKVIAWGHNVFFQARVPDSAGKNIVAVAAGCNHSLALLDDGIDDGLIKGKVIAWGSNASGQATPPKTTLRGITQIAAGFDHNLALTSNRTVVAWGGNIHGQSANHKDATGIIQVSAGNQFSVAVKGDRTGKVRGVIAWGRNNYGQTTIPPQPYHSAFAGYDNTILGLPSGPIIVLGNQAHGVAVSRTPTRTATTTR
jgi:alpha-tubulin suppressor-like RCC1 family protein